MEESLKTHVVELTQQVRGGTAAGVTARRARATGGVVPAGTARAAAAGAVTARAAAPQPGHPAAGAEPGRCPCPERPRREHAAAQASEMPDPADSRRTGDGYLQDGPVRQGGHDPDTDVNQVPVEEPADQDIAEVPEDKPARPHGQLVAALEEPHRQPADHRDDEG